VTVSHLSFLTAATAAGSKADVIIMNLLSGMPTVTAILQPQTFAVAAV